VIPFSFPFALRAFRAFGAFERNVDFMHRLAFPFESALSFAVWYGKLNLLDWWLIGVRESATRSAGAFALLEIEAG
jgi:hypothetical protein